MSSFDLVFGGAAGDEPREPERLEQPTWFGPPPDELGVAIPAEAVLARGERVAVGLRSLTVYSSGLTLDLVAVTRNLKPSEANRVMHEQHVFVPDEEPSPLLLRIGVTLADGRRASNLGGHPFAKPDEVPEGPVFLPRGGGGSTSGGGAVTLHPSYWLWPLPPGDELTLACEWPAFELPLSERRLDAATIRAAAARSIRLWDASPSSA